MSNVLFVASRHGEFGITQADIRRAQKPDTLAARLDRIWDKITDWFLGTNYTEAKRHLRVLYDADASPEAKAESFFRLKSLAAPAYQDRFSVAVEPFGYALRIDYGGRLDPYEFSIRLCDPDALAAALNEHTSKAITDPAARETYEKALLADIPPSRYSLRTDRIRFTDDEPRLVTFREAIANVPGNLNQMTAATAIASQKFFAYLIESSSAVVDPRKFMHIGGEGQTTYNFYSDRKGGVVMHARSAAQWQSDIKSPEAMKQIEALAGQRPAMLLDPVYDARIVIDSDGRVSVLSAVVGMDPDRKP